MTINVLVELIIQGHYNEFTQCIKNKASPYYKLSPSLLALNTSLTSLLTKYSLEIESKGLKTFIGLLKLFYTPGIK